MKRIGQSVTDGSRAAAIDDTLAPPSPHKGRARRRDAVVNRDKLLASAAELMALHGHNVPLADIAEKAGVGIGTLYRGFRDRPALLGELQRRGYELLLSCLAQIRADGLTGADALEEYLDKCLTLSDQLVALPLRGVAPLGDDAAVDAKRRIVGTIGDFLAEGEAEGTVCPDVTTTDILVFGTLVATPLPLNADWDSTARQSLRIFMRGVRRAPST